jgi:chromosome segregation ATPase
MRKAFETNVPRLKPRLRSSFDSGPAGEQASFDSGPAEGGPYALDERPVNEAVTAPAPAPARAAPVRSAIAAAAAAPARQAGDVVSRRDRLEKIKRRVAEAARPAPRHAPVPGDPARAAESVLSLVGELESEVSRAREREEALRTDLDGVRTELSRAAAEGRSATERLTAAEKELQEKRSVLTELLAEMEALEQERDEAVRRAQALSSLDEERARILEDVTRKADEEAKLRADREAEVERLGEELRTSAADGARLRTAVGELARERDQLAGELDRIRSERDDLASAKRALEQVHAALAQARAKII